MVFAQNLELFFRNFSAETKLMLSYYETHISNICVESKPSLHHIFLIANFKVIARNLQFIAFKRLISLKMHIICDIFDIRYQFKEKVFNFITFKLLGKNKDVIP